MIQQSVPRVKYLAIVKGEKISESQEAFRKQVVCFVCPDNDQPSEDEQLRTMGLVLGTIQFCDQFSTEEGNEYMYLDTDLTRTIVLKFESIYWLICVLRFTKIPEGSSFDGIALPQHIANVISLGYKAFSLHHGAFVSCNANEISTYWKRWAQSFPTDMYTRGSGSLCLFTSRSFVKKSLLPAHVGDAPCREALDFCISDVSRGEHYGMLQMTTENIEQDSMADLLNYIHNLDSCHAFELEDQANAESEASNLMSYLNVARTLEVFDPFSSALDSMGHYFWPRAPTTPAVDEGDKTLEGKFVTKNKHIYLATKEGTLVQFLVALYKVGDILFTLVLKQEPREDQLKRSLDEYYRLNFASRPTSDELSFCYVLADASEKTFYSSLPMTGDSSLCPSPSIHSMIYNILLERKAFDTTEIVTKQQKNLWTYHKIMPEKELIVIKKFRSDDKQKSKVFLDTKGKSDQVILSLGDDVADWFDSIKGILES